MVGTDIVIVIGIDIQEMYREWPSTRLSLLVADKIYPTHKSYW